MKRVLILIIIAFSFLLVNARQPYGDYIVRYIVTDATTYKPTDMRLIIEPDYAHISRWAANYIAHKINTFGPTAEKPDVARNIFRNRNAESQDCRSGIGDLAVRADHIAAQSLFA